MGIGAPMVALYHQLMVDKVLEGPKDIIEFGSQDLHCAGYEALINRVFAAAGRPLLEATALHALANSGPARQFYEHLGWRYRCIDTDGRHGALVLDLNFDEMPADEKGKYDVVTNFGTTEHLLNQLNAFRGLHDLARPGGLILHILPFVGCIEHGFFTYQPNFFYALARFNSYEVLGLWFNVNTALSSLIPWQHGLLNHISVSPTNDSVLVVALRKLHAAKFCVPFQGVYEFSQVPENLQRYEYVVDGEILNSARIAHLTKSGLFGR